MLYGTLVHWCPPMTWTGLDEVTSVPVRSFGSSSLEEPLVTTSRTSPALMVTVPAPEALIPVMPCLGGSGHRPRCQRNHGIVFPRGNGKESAKSLSSVDGP